ncbi:putative signal peptide protein [Puccinia sorghi]|uniref:Putative signal peptide protein n=1 Tax=Puccinia sorghi TaxID=27349 RepID=A0A0L6UX41_9BASI|nr:putative signal peptide protein [Puccinia sorghi]
MLSVLLQFFCLCCGIKKMSVGRTTGITNKLNFSHSDNKHSLSPLFAVATQNKILNIALNVMKVFLTLEKPCSFSPPTTHPQIQSPWLPLLPPQIPCQFPLPEEPSLRLPHSSFWFSPTETSEATLVFPILPQCPSPQNQTSPNHPSSPLLTKAQDNPFIPTKFLKILSFLRLLLRPTATALPINTPHCMPSPSSAVILCLIVNLVIISEKIRTLTKFLKSQNFVNQSTAEALRTISSTISFIKKNKPLDLRSSNPKTSLAIKPQTSNFCLFFFSFYSCRSLFFILSLSFLSSVLVFIALSRGILHPHYQILVESFYYSYWIRSGWCEKKVKNIWYFFTWAYQKKTKNKLKVMVFQKSMMNKKNIRLKNNHTTRNNLLETRPDVTCHLGPKTTTLLHHIVTTRLIFCWMIKKKHMEFQHKSIQNDQGFL